ncbi:DUF2017 family protein [Xylanimonas protaetiae]|uniref:DUF2017 family protein n=1 Tax=Xylanimonas protaetiae TaxID=2509457 RepID=A0A4V0YG94_9MICO|nr:DUF2017 family protein [Xylanimonas protaetiae]QAY70421.1 DUF2017 family protein [Xylanimonas protaetiae]
MTPFRPGPDGYEASWEEAERHVLAGVAREVAALLREQAGLPDTDADDPLGALAATMQSTGTPREPDDPAARRLLPDASRDDASVSAEFRHLTQTDLAAAKVRGLELFADLLDGAALDDVDPSPAGLDYGLDDELDDRAVVLVTRQDARDVAAALTDVRLVVAQRLGLETDDDVETLHDEVLADAVDDDAARGLDADVRRYWGGIFVAAGFAQESLVGAMLDDHRASRSGG